jgi:UDP-2,3-diacylglucosamine pyrophosphatase LpxH
LRTLVISDLHLGNRGGRDVLRRLPARRALLSALADVDRLVILGDLAELVTRNPERPLGMTEPVLREVGRELGPEREVILVPGNHDSPLVRRWIRERGDRLGVDDVVPLDASRTLQRVVEWLSPARVSVRYPGVWLTPEIYATHGHYLDRHLFPAAPVGLLRDQPPWPESPWEYERRHARRRPHAPLRRRMLERPLPTLAEITGQITRRFILPSGPRLLLYLGLSSVTATTVDVQMRRASLPAMRRTLRQLEIDAQWVIFGHVHRLGPVAADDPAEWNVAGGPRLINSGAWMYEPLLVDGASTPHPYWPGGAVWVEDGRPPEAVGLLDHLSSEELRPPGGR